MPLMEACAYLGIGGQDSMIISDEFSAKDIIDWVRNIEKGWAGYDKKDDAIRSMFANMIIEEDYNEDEYHDGDENINEEFFTEQYNYFLKLNKEEGREFQITVLDLHT